MLHHICHFIIPYTLGFAASGDGGTGGTGDATCTNVLILV
jgi:hypothetical protein